jgi:hypothetical protein
LFYNEQKNRGLAMIPNELLKQLHELDRFDKLHVIQLLAKDLSQEEGSQFVEGTHYEIWSPYDSAEAANTLLQMLEDDKSSHE